MNLPFTKGRFHYSQNKNQLRNLLLLNDPSQETIFGILGRMEILMDYLNRPKYKTLLPFLKTYYWVTKQGAEKYILYKHFFWNVKDYETLDVYFASLYFKPLLMFLEGKAVPKPWQHYFEYCQKTNGLPFLQILLGINAHINTDLFQAVLDLDYKNKEDFFLVNKILKEIVPEVVKLLARQHDLVGLGGLAFSEFINSEFQNIIIRWRSEVWDNVQLTNSSHRLVNYRKLTQSTEKTAIILIKNFEQIYHLQHLPENIRQINQLSVKLPEG